MEVVLEVVDERLVLPFAPTKSPAGPLDGFLCAPATGHHHERLDVRKVESLVGQRGGDHRSDVARLELFHGSAAGLLRHLGMDEDGTIDCFRVLLTEGHPGDENEGLRLALGEHDCGGIPVLVLADTDVGDGFPSAHGAEFLVSDPHVAFAVGEEFLDVVIDLLLDMVS